MVIVPSRDTIPRYAERKKEIDEFIGDINSSIGNITWKPVIYQYAHIDFPQLIALYTACDMALITPLRDGMNLVAKEFVASRKDLKGVLLLSEMTGAARELSDALLINPNDIDGVARKIKEGLEMNEEEQSRRLSVMQKRLQQYNVNTWAEDFFTQLDSIKTRQKEFEFMFLDRDSKQLLYERYHNAKSRLLLLDYDGTLVPFSPLPQEAQPDASLLSLLNLLCRSEHNSVYIISGRDSITLEQWLGDLPVNLIAEHGAKTKSNNCNWRVDRHIHTDEDWKEIIQPIMENYVKRCANTFIEQKEFSLVWHFTNAEPQQAKVRASELHAELKQVVQNLNVHVVAGNKIIEVLTKGIDKGYVVRKLLKENNFDFILACGDDNTDEDMFKVLANNKNAFTIKIGDEASYAKYNLYTPQMAVSLLAHFVNQYH
jgi:trehalose 6-phosphate synthase/phosphatase